MSTSDSTEANPARSISMLGVKVTPLTISELIGVVEHVIETDQRQVVIGNHNVNSISLCQRHQGMRSFYARADFTLIDGMPLIAHANLMGVPLRREQRVTMVDLLPFLLDECQKRNWNVVFLGGTMSVASKAKQMLTTRFPELRLHVHHGYFDITPNATSNTSILNFINAHEPHVLLVGMGMPRQEEWIARHVDQLSANVIIPIGAGMDYFAGEIPTPPRWMGRVGLEWFYRLLSEPRRLYRRYLFEPWRLVPLMLRDYHARFSGKS